MHTDPVRSPLRFYERRGGLSTLYRADHRISRQTQGFDSSAKLGQPSEIFATYSTSCPSTPPPHARGTPSPPWRVRSRATAPCDNRLRLSMQQRALAFPDADDFVRSVSPFRELGAYEWLWAQSGTTFKKLAEKFRARPESLPSDFVPHHLAEATATQVRDLLAAKGIRQFGVTLHHTTEYPAALRDAEHPVELLYSLGTWNFLESPCIAVVGTRRPTPEALADTDALVRGLVAADWTIVSGLADGIDAQAHTSALDAAGRTVAVIGTPISEVYPRANAALQERIAREFLVISQVPVLRYHQQSWMQNRAFFRERNVTMAALTRASIIVEAGEMSGARILARAAVEQGRPLFILDRCFRDPAARWPHAFVEEHGAIRVTGAAEIVETLRGVHRDR
jgi:DNA processing protein